MQKLLFIIISILPTLLSAHENLSLAQPGEPHKRASVFQGYSGGMMVHAGYLFGETAAPAYNTWSGATLGIGGALRIHLWQHLRVGAEGYVSTMPANLSNQRGQLKNGSYIRSGWGGIVADACWRKEKVWPYIGGGIGGGSCRSLYIYDGDEADWNPESTTIFHKDPFFYVNPYVGIDWCMTRRVHLTFKLDWLIALHKQTVVQPTGPRLYFGFMFCH